MSDLDQANRAASNTFGAPSEGPKENQLACTPLSPMTVLTVRLAAIGYRAKR
jgi:hypothetical protein